MGKPPQHRTSHAGLLSRSPPSVGRLIWVPGKSNRHIALYTGPYRRSCSVCWCLTEVLACGDQHRCTGSGSERCVHDDALNKCMLTLPYLYLTRLTHKGKGLDTCYSTAYMSQTRDQQRFTILERQLIGMSQWCHSALCGHPLPVLTDNWIHSAASRHTIAAISHTKPSPRSRSYYSFPVPLRVGGWLGLSTQ